MAEDPHPQTIQQRIAALNQAHVASPQPPGSRPSPPAGAKPNIPTRRPGLPPQKSINLPPATVHGTVSQRPVGNEPNGVGKLEILPPPVITRTGQKTVVDEQKHARPALPVRQKSSQTAPALPPRTVSTEHAPPLPDVARRNVSMPIATCSTASPATSQSGHGVRNRILAPAWNEGQLPPLPPSRPKDPHPVRVSLKSMKSTPALVTAKEIKPPPLPTRKDSNDQIGTSTFSNSVQEVRRKLPPLPPTVKSKLAGLGFTSHQNEHQTTDDTGARASVPNGAPPPIPLSSRPDLSRIQSTKPNINARPDESTVCMKCRDFSGPDTHASRFPRQSLPSQDLSWLAVQLTSPFPSLTDKARVIFTWLHHNVSYDVDAFFNNCVKPSTPASTFQSGLAVCEGYAGLYATLATHAGLESIVITGHGKGFGHSQLAPGAPLPPFAGNHAWNVVKIDNGAWKLIDSCWGAGHISGKGQPYTKMFHPECFTMTNDEFGNKHFPTNKAHFFRDDGRPSISWDEYMSIDPDRPNGIEPPTIYTGATATHGVGPETFLPQAKRIPISSSSNSPIRFQFSLLCPHYTLSHHLHQSSAYPFILITHSPTGAQDSMLVFDYVRGRNGPYGAAGDAWVLDVPDRRVLGVPGQKVCVFAVTSFGDVKGEGCRGLSVEQVRAGIGRVGMGFQGVAEWILE